MVYVFDGSCYIIRLNKGERLSEALAQFGTQTGLEGAWVSGVGGALEVTLGYYDLSVKSYQWRTFKGLREITGLQGNLAYDQAGECMFHLHGTFSDKEFAVIGGHIKDLVAGATVELYVQTFGRPLHRRTDNEVGLQTLNI